MARRLMTIPGLGPVTASAMAASVQDASAFSGPREFAAFLGLTPFSCSRSFRRLTWSLFSPPYYWRHR